ncbi:MAG TPA: hypothetical protein VHT03_14275 [Rhizomicrobium sp.]|jgi:hypothetical protein|nr:hypothetical protein [Rhizomicrobium sp.]
MISRGKSFEEQRQKQRERAKRAALRALRRARIAAAENGAKLSGWENEFLGSVEERIETYGRAFGDPQKGAAGASLSNRQGGKLREIAAKARGKGSRRS